MLCGVLLAVALGGPFPLLCTPYTEKGELDCEVLAKEAAFVADGGANGVIWPPANDAINLLTPDEERRGLETIASVLEGRNLWFCPCCPGTNTADAVRRIAVGEEIAARHPKLATTYLVRMANDAKADADHERHYEAVAAATKRPVIIQTFNAVSPRPSAKLIVELAKRHPGTFGWVKAEGDDKGIPAYIAELLAAKPAIKTVFTGWGGRDWLYHHRRLGTRGVISQRPHYAPLMVRLWRALEANSPEADDLYAKWMYLRNLDDVLPSAEMRGVNLYALVRLGIFRNMVSREKKPGGGWALRNEQFTPVQMAEVDSRLRFAGLLPEADSADIRSGGYDVAAYVWPAYQPEPRWAELGIFKDGKGEWQNVYEATKRFPDDHQGVKPLWGYENEANPVAVARKIDAATAAGVNVFIYDWYWYGGRPFLENALNEGFLKASNCERMKFYLMYANHDVTKLWDNRVGGPEKDAVVWPSKISDNDWETIVERWISKYFKRPNYYKIRGCPVLSIYDVDTFVGWEGLEKAKARLDYLRLRVKASGFPGLHLQVLAHSQTADKVGADSMTIYNWLYRTGERIASKQGLTFREWGELAIGNFDEAKAKAEGCGAVYFPNLTIGWDTNARFPVNDARNIVHGSNPVDFERFARRTRVWADANLASGLPKLITVNSWNEWTEGSYLEPDDIFGYGYLNALWRVFVEETKTK